MCVSFRNYQDRKSIKTSIWDGQAFGAGITRSREGKGNGEKRSEKWNTPERWVGERAVRGGGRIGRFGLVTSVKSGNEAISIGRTLTLRLSRFPESKNILQLPAARISVMVLDQR